MINGMNTLGWIAILCGFLGFDGSPISTAANGILHDFTQDKSALLNDHQQLALQQTRSSTEIPNQWVELGRRVHGSFGSYITLGIRIGLDAMQRLSATLRTLEVTYYDCTLSLCCRWHYDCNDFNSWTKLTASCHDCQPRGHVWGC